MRCAALAFAQLVLIVPAWTAEKQDPCSTAPTASDVQFTLAIQDHAAIFQYGEIIPITLSFSSATKDRYSIDLRNYDRSGRLGSEVYCVEPKAADPLDTYFKAGAFMGGGLGTEAALTETPQVAQAELNEWHTFSPGHYRVYAVSYRVWRPAEDHDNVPYSRVSERVASNAIEIEVNQPDPDWQQRQLRGALLAVAGAGSAEEQKHAARILRFLNTQQSTRELARLFWGLNQQQAVVGGDLMFGLFGSPYRQLAIDSLRAEIANPDHAITDDFLRTLVNLEISGDAKWDPPTSLAGDQQEAQTFWTRRQAHMNELRDAEVRAAAAALAHKAPSARALTLNGLVTAAGDNSALGQTLRPVLIAAWADLPRETQQQLIQYRWSLVAGPEMLPILRRMIAEPPPASRTTDASVRTEAFKHLYELDPEAGRAAIRKELLNPEAEPAMELVTLLPKEDIAAALRPAVERIERRNGRLLDFHMVDQYGDASVLPSIKTGYEAATGGWACDPQAAVLRYFLRFDPEYGSRQVAAALAARKNTGCYRMLLSDLGAEVQLVQGLAIAALDDPDPDVSTSAIGALRQWGTADAEKALWDHLKAFHKEWADGQDKLRRTTDYRSPGSRAVNREVALVSAIGQATNWLCFGDKIAELLDLVWTRDSRQLIAGWPKTPGGPATIMPQWYPVDKPTFSLMQYSALIEDQLKAKVTQFPEGTVLIWQFWNPGEISPPVGMDKQEAAYDRVRAVAERHGVTIRKN